MRSPPNTRPSFSPHWPTDMRRAMLTCLLAATLAVAAAPLRAQTTDPLWTSVVAQLEGARRWAPAEIELVNDAGSGSDAKHSVATMRLSGWKEGKPVYELVKIQPPDKKPPKDFDFLNGLTSLADSLTSGATPRRTDGQPLDGGTYSVFEDRFDETLHSGSVRLWVDPVSGAPRQMVLVVHVPLMVDATITTRYSPGPQGYAMPAHIDYAIQIQIPFKKGRAHLQQTSTSWVARPSAPAGAPAGQGR